LTAGNVEIKRYDLMQSINTRQPDIFLD